MNKQVSLQTRWTKGKVLSGDPELSGVFYEHVLLIVLQQDIFIQNK
jgi:hypothetical protein